MNSNLSTPYDDSDWNEDSPLDFGSANQTHGDADINASDIEVMERQLAETSPGGSNIRAVSLGIVGSGVFYLGAYFIPWAPLQRYFLGHPVAIAATTLFWVAVAILASKYMTILTQSIQLRSFRDDSVTPEEASGSPADRWLQDHDAGHVARRWLAMISDLPGHMRSTLLVRRLSELLIRQSRRGTTKHLSDDLREISNRDADVAHDSLGLVRIIVWAIPMLGFLGTVIGITQTLGGLDFTDGTGAVDRLKAGLYVAFDTTALGLVLSVVAIFLQFPVERSEQQLLAEVDTRVGNLVSAGLPSDEAADNQTALIAELCGGIQAAVAQSLASQAELWRSTIDEAQTHWREVQKSSVNEFADAIETSLAPALQQHATSLQQSSEAAESRLISQADAIRNAIDKTAEFWSNAENDSAERFAKTINDSLHPALAAHADSLKQSAETSAQQLDLHSQQWKALLDENAKAIFSHQEDIIDQCEELVALNQSTESIQAAQASLDANLLRLVETNSAVAESVEATATESMTEAMLALARAVDVLNDRMPKGTGNTLRGRAA